MPEPSADPPCFELLDTLGAFSLTRASPTLDGSIPLRAAQACTPFLDGNRAGFQLKLAERLTLHKSLGRITLKDPPERLLRALRGSVPRLGAEGILPASGGWVKRLERGLVWREGRSSRVELFTGLLLRPSPGVLLRVGNAGNRRNVLFEVEERWLGDSASFAPLVLSLELGDETRFPLSLHGELATLIPFDPRVSLVRRELATATDVGRAHLDFYDQRYFEQKKRGSTKKYKKMLARQQPSRVEATCRAEVVVAGPEHVVEARPGAWLTPEGIARQSGPSFPYLCFTNAVPFRASFDGHDTWVEPDRRALERFAESTSAAWAAAYDAETLQARRGAIWYFTKYVTPHQAGEPLFFVKPPALIRTPPGWSTLVEGIPGPGYEVLRGVVATDRFHALPALFRLDYPGRRVSLKAGVPLARFIPIPRRLVDASFAELRWSYAP